MNWSGYTHDWSEREAVLAQTTVAMARQVQENIGKLGSNYVTVSATWTDEDNRLLSINVSSTEAGADDDDDSGD